MEALMKNDDMLYGYIYVSHDYDKFTRVKGNRNPKSAKKIIESINNVGYILNPILVNEKFEVIDGQNRLDALRELGLPVHYIVQKGIGIEECRALNINQTVWKMDDYIVSYAESGYESYQKLLKLMNEFRQNGLNTEAILLLCCPYLVKESGGYNADVRDGSIVISDKRFELGRIRIRKAIDLGLLGFKNKYGFTARTFWGAISYAFEHNDVDITVLAKRLLDDPHSVKPTSKTSDQLSYFDAIYNKGRKVGSKVFMETDFLNGKYLKEEN